MECYEYYETVDIDEASQQYESSVYKYKGIHSTNHLNPFSMLHPHHELDH